jgi:hypothetical protein
MTRHRFLLGAALLTLAAARPLSAQRVLDWQYRWYWGAKGGMLSYTLPSGSRAVPQVGAEWLITARRVALYIGYSSTFAAEADTFAVPGLTGGARGVTFDAFRRIQIGLLTLIGDKAFQPYVGGGFVIQTLSNARSTAATPTTTDVNAITAAASGGFLQVMAGFQLRMGKKAALFAHYQLSPQGRAFLLAGGANSFEGGLRYAFLSAKEDDPTRRQ